MVRFGLLLMKPSNQHFRSEMDEDVCFSRQSNMPNPSCLLGSIRTPFHSFEGGSQQGLSLLLRLTLYLAQVNNQLLQFN